MDIKFDCPYCQQHLEASDDMSGQLIDCPICQHTIEVPYALLSDEERERRKQQYLRDMVQKNWEEMQMMEKKEQKRKNFIEKVKMISFATAIAVPTIFLCIIFDPNSGCTWVDHERNATKSYSGWCTIKSRCIGWRDSSEFDKSLDLAISGDTAAWETHWRKGVIDGRAANFYSGTRVYIEERAIFSERVRVRKEGETEAYWVPISELDL